jgi:hypothetical protein
MATVVVLRQSQCVDKEGKHHDDQRRKPGERLSGCEATGAIKSKNGAHRYLSGCQVVTLTFSEINVEKKRPPRESQKRGRK